MKIHSILSLGVDCLAILFFFCHTASRRFLLHLHVLSNQRHMGLWVGYPGWTLSACFLLWRFVFLFFFFSRSLSSTNLGVVGDSICAIRGHMPPFPIVLSEAHNDPNRLVLHMLRRGSWEPVVYRVYGVRMSALERSALRKPA